MEPILSVVVPVYNEERTLVELLRRVREACPSAELIVVDDGSTDSSLALARAHVQPGDTVLSKPNGGKGSAVRAGYGVARGRYVVVQDADLEYDPADIPRLLALAEAGDHPVVFGSRRLKRQRQYVHVTFFVGGTLLTWICNALYGTRLTDQPCCYKMVRSDVLRKLRLEEDDFRFDPELTAQVSRLGFPIVEHPVSYHPRTVAEGKKIGWKDWFRWVGVFVRLRFTAPPAGAR